jgi:hypothetical protein
LAEIITDANLISQYAEKIMEEPAPVIVTRAPSESTVTLPGGLVRPTGEVVKEAEVRELNGADEEAIAKAGNTGKALNILLERGLVSLGGERVSKADLDTLLSGDRDAILLGIRRVTFGDTITVPVSCQHCSEEYPQEIDLSKDVPVKELTETDARRWVVPTKLGDAVVTLPNGIVQKRLMENLDKTVAEINTLVLSGCILSLAGAPAVGASTALSLSMQDRTEILSSIVERTPGPRLGEVTKACKACGEAMELPLSLVDLFRL